MQPAIRRAGTVALGLVCAAALLPATPAHAIGLRWVRTTADTGPGSLRDAITQANGSLGLDIISFRLPSPGLQVINLASDLPAITDPVVIDGYTQSGASPATATTPASLLVVVDGYAAGRGLELDAGGSTVAGLVVVNVGRTGASSGGDCAGSGICVTGDGNTIRGNYVGLRSSGTATLGNAQSGVVVTGSDNVVGGPDLADRNVISGNGLHGVEIEEGSGNEVRGNRIGTSADGSADLGNTGDGVYLDGASAAGAPNTVDVVAGNVISGNDAIGVELDSHATVCTLTGNLIGTDAAGTAAVPNDVGVLIRGDVNTVGTAGPGEGNTIAGNTDVGIEVAGLAFANTINSNLIGVGAGATGLGNGGHGVWLNSSRPNNLGTDGGNQIAANGGDGVRIDGADQDLLDNLIGVVRDDTGALVARGNAGTGILVSQDRAHIVGNVIGANGGAGISLDASGDEAVIQGNAIGTDLADTANLGNTGAGIEIQGSDNTIGSTDPAAAANVIAHNGGAGVAVTDAGAVDNPIVRNLIHDNTGLGIDLYVAGLPGRTPNDPGDGDADANDLQNFPQNIRARTFVIGDPTSVQWTLDSTVGRFRVEFYVRSSCTTGTPTYLGYVDAAIGPAGPITLTTPVPSVLPGMFLVATATERINPGRNGSTSEFSACVLVTN